MESTHQKPSIGFVGLGLMGYGMATNLVRKGYQVYGYDISSSILDRFEKDGGHPCQKISELTKENDYYICMMASATQVQSVLFDTEDAIIKTLPNGTTFILCSTVPASYVKSVQEEFSKLGRNDIYFVDSPVSGGAARAAAGTLTIMAGGSESALTKADCLLKDMSAPKKLFIVGDIGAGSNMKMAHQVLAGIQILAASEAMGFASKLGVDPRKIKDEVCTSDGWSWMYENRVPRMLEEDYFPGVSALTVILKDVVSITIKNSSNSIS
jgi:3-hydroxyisobutyrate dehydrogenase